MFGIKFSATVGTIVTLLVAAATGVIVAGVGGTAGAIAAAVIAAGAALGIRVAKPGGDA